MKEDKRAGAFIPCGDAMEKMSEIKETDLEKVSGGNQPSHAASDEDYIEKETMLIIPIA